ncbi:MAG TPA: TraB/GumN family protein [Candidatus Binatia bacterium]
MMESRLRLIFDVTFRLVLLAALFVLVGESRAQEKSFLWQLQSGKGNIYILGSIHFLQKENYPLNPTIEKAFDSTKKLVLEIDLKSADSGTVQRLTLEKGLHRDGKTLQENISAETYSLAAKRAQELGIDIGALSPLKPWVVALTMTSLQLQRLGFDPNSGVDRYLAERATKAGKPMAGLETAAFQIGLMDQLSASDQESMLRHSLKEMDLLDKGLDQIVRSWAAGDVPALEDLLVNAMREYPAVHQKIIVDRNRRWLPEIERMIEQGESTLVVVGAAHLVGKEGVIELLKARGYTLKQM